MSSTTLGGRTTPLTLFERPSAPQVPVPPPAAGLPAGMLFMSSIIFFSCAFAAVVESTRMAAS